MCVVVYAQINTFKNVIMRCPSLNLIYHTNATKQNETNMFIIKLVLINITTPTFIFTVFVNET